VEKLDYFVAFLDFYKKPKIALRTKEKMTTELKKYKRKMAQTPAKKSCRLLRIHYITETPRPAN